MPLKQILRTSHFTADFSERHLDKLAALASTVEFKEDQLILVAGQRSQNLFLLLSGSVVVEVRTPFYVVCVQALKPGDAFGWSSLLNQQDTLFQVRARETVTAIRWEGTALLAACEEDAAFGMELLRRLLQLVAGRVKATETRLGEFCGIAGQSEGCSVDYSIFNG